MLYATKALNGLSGENEDENAGIAIVKKAIQTPLRQIIENSGVEASIVVGKLLEQKSMTYGFDAQDEKYVDLIEAGIVDPTKVVRIALQNASSVAALLITTEAMVDDRPAKTAASGGHAHGGGMGKWTSTPKPSNIPILKQRAWSDPGPLRLGLSVSLSANTSKGSPTMTYGPTRIAKLPAPSYCTLCPGRLSKSPEAGEREIRNNRDLDQPHLQVAVRGSDGSIPLLRSATGSAPIL